MATTPTSSWSSVSVWSSAIGSILAAQGQQDALRFQAEMADINAKAADNAARGALFAGQREGQRSMLSTANLKSAQTAKFAASGVDLGVGSAARTLASTDIMGKIDANTIAANAVRSAWGYRTQGTSYRNDALTRRSAADSINPWLEGASSALTTAGRVDREWYALNRVRG
jgi:hypothetical protein